MKRDIKRQDRIIDILFYFLVGVGRFELPTSSSRTKRANRAALHPDIKELQTKVNIICSVLTLKFTMSLKTKSPDDPGLKSFLLKNIILFLQL